MTATTTDAGSTTAAPSAAKTAKPGTSTAPITKKLQIKPGYSVGVLSAPEGFRAKLDPLPDGVTVADELGTGMDMVIAFARNGAEADTLVPAALRAVKPKGLLWLSYLKGGAKAGTDLNRDILWQRVKPLGLEGVALVAIDDAWSAMRFRIDKA